ncbi:DEAD/DEAH box helicase [Halobacillus salinus]|uniref:DEAD/DEAH box helicase n=1 Tax=Halobacillus salinus TaxID=192814 RepID=A0A4Z0H262_9BACI|nr:DEAD/DEAH box helicase [Halobacillus salinus]TGB03501.1 DEAD/DEAH box helicase [Halobacillus salinus]
MNFFNRKKKHGIEIHKRFGNEGLHISVMKKGELLPLPLNLRSDEIASLNNLGTVLELEELFYEGMLKEEAEGYLLPYEQVYNLTEESRALLGLPVRTVPLFIKLDSKGFVSSSNFRLEAKYGTEDQPNLYKVSGKHGPFILSPGKDAILIPKEQHDFMSLVELPLPDRSSQSLFYHIAEVKKLADQLEIPVSEHLKREQYEFIEEMELDVHRDSAGISVTSLYKHDKLSDSTLSNPDLTRAGYGQLDGKRVFVANETKKKAQSIQQLDKIKGDDIPRFVQNPEGFLPEDIAYSRDLFGDRVKNLGIRVYKASPYIHAKESNNGWFDFETGFQFKDDGGETIFSEGEDFFSEDGSQSFKQVDEDIFVTIPDQVQEFQDRSRRLKEFSQQESNAKAYVLEIFENLQNVEYNQPLQEMREALHDNKIIDKTPPSIFTATLRPFQEEGYVWMKSLRLSGHGGLLADDMGLGKTIQVIAYLTYLKEQRQLTPTLLVVPKTLMENWLKEIKKFAPLLAENCICHIGADRLKDPDLISQYDLVFTTYQTLVRDQITLGQVDWQMVIADEAQHIKNPSTGASVVLKALKNKGRIALTGTPVENNLSELWSIVDYVQPGVLGSLKSFKVRYEKPLQNENADFASIQSDIESQVRFIYKRRTKQNQLKKELPAKIEHHGEWLAPLGKQQHHLYGQILYSIQAKQIPAISGIQELKKLCSHPGLVDAEMKTLKVKEVPKLYETIKLLKEIQTTKEKVLIFTEYRLMQIILKQAIADEFSINPKIINGATESRQYLVDNFNELEGFNVLILSPRAAGTGLTITGANHVIHYTRWWNPAVENQATDRAYRIGQDKDVHVYYPMVTSGKGNTVEVVVNRLLEEKKALAENIIVPSKDLDTDQILNDITIS